MTSLLAPPDPFELAARAFEDTPQTYQWPTPGDLAAGLDPRTVNTPALDLIDRALVDTWNTPDGRLIISMPPQEGKSQRASRRFPEWVLARRPDTRIAVASYAHTVARRFSRMIRDDITAYGPRLGLSVRPDLSGQTEWQVDGHDGGVYAVGIAGALTSRPVDLLLIDDPIKDRKQADSEVWRETAWDFWLEAAATRLAPGAPAIVILTRWHEDDLAGRLLAADDGNVWRVLNIPAQADHRPEHGGTDPLGREPGEFMVSARGRTRAQWEAIKTRSAGRTWSALYQGRPAPAEGAMFKRDWWRFYDTPLWVDRDDGARLIPVVGEDIQVIQSWDMTFKNTAGSDYVVGQVWMRRGSEVFLLDQIRRRATFTETVQAVRELTARWPQATAKLVEDKANGPAVMSMLGRQVPGLIPVEPDGSKSARAAAVTPFVEAGNVVLPVPELCPWIADYVEELAGFPTSAHDDQVDATSQALHRLLLNPLLSGEIFEAADLDDDVADYRIGADY